MPREAVRSVPLSATFLIVTAGWGVNTAITMIAPILPQIAARGGYNSHEVQFAAELVMTVAGLGIMVGGILSGPLQDWLGTRKVILSSLLLAGVAGSAGFEVRDLVLLGLSRAFLGAAAACAIASLSTLLAELYAKEARGRLLGYQNAANGAFNIAGTLLAGLVATTFGWQYVFLVYGVFGTFAFFLALAGASDIRRHDIEAKPTLASTATDAWKLLLGGIGTFVLIVIPFAQASFILTADGVTEAGVRALVLSAAAVLQIVGAGVYGSLRKHMSSAVVIQLGILIAAAGAILIGMASTAVLVAIGAALVGFTAGLVPTVLIHKAVERPQHLRARLLGLMQAAFFTGVLVNPFVVAPLQSAFGLRTALELLGLIALATVATMAISRRWMTTPQST